MNDNFEFTLRSPLTKEDWNKLSDAELEHTESITFQTPQGRQVRYIKCDVLDKIKRDIFNACSDNYHMPVHNLDCDTIFEIIDKYKTEGEEDGYGISN